MTTFSNEKFNNSWSEVEKAFNELKDSNILPLTIESGKEQIEKTIPKLEEALSTWKNETFTVAICGQVKAGKSTLLNSLFFGDDILPMFDTPMTAKLTFIRHNEQGENGQGFYAEFYSQEEWDALLNVSDEKIKEQLNDRLEYSFTQGVNGSDCIGTRMHRSNLKELDEFVSVPQSGKKSSKNCGKYTPFVKQVTIHVPFDNFKNVVVVDTPGLNDSNTINSDQTSKWIHKAHAVVYVLDVTGPHEPDVKFFEKFFPGSAVDARIFVQNKIDTDPEADQVKDNIRKYGEQLTYKNLGLFGKNETICSYSGLLVLRNKKKKEGIPTTEMEELPYEQFDWIDEDFNPDPDNLVKTIEEKLYTQTGAIRISKAFGEFISLGEEKIRQLDMKANNCKEDAENYNKTDEDLEKDIQHSTEFYHHMTEVANKIKATNSAFLVSNYTKLGKMKDEINGNIIKKLEMELSRFEGTKSIKNRFANIFKRIISNAYADVPKELNRFKADVYEYLTKTKKDLRSEAMRHKVDVSSLGSAEYIENEYDNTMNEKIYLFGDISSTLDDKLPGFFMNIFTSLEEVKSKALNIAEEALDIIGEEFINICFELRCLAEKQMNSYSQVILSWAEKKKDRIEEIKSNKEKNKNEAENLLNLANKFNAEAQEISTLVKGFKQRKDKLS